MKNGYNIQWTDNAINELKETIHYLQEKWTEKELKCLAIELEKTTLLIAKKSIFISGVGIQKKHPKGCRFKT